MTSTSAAEALLAVKNDISVLCESLGRPEPVLIAVSKTKPVALLREVYDAGHRDFGENYVAEFVEKHSQLPDDIRWHFIGHIQSNKCNQLLSVPGLVNVQTVDREKIASKLDSAAKNAGRSVPLDVLVQVNISDEESKSGVKTGDVSNLVSHIVDKCQHLQFRGLMAIGRSGVDEDFKRLYECRNLVAKQLDVSADELELSMGMSSDFAAAIEAGSTTVRVGTTIFGARDYSKAKT